MQTTTVEMHQLTQPVEVLILPVLFLLTFAAA